MIVKSEYFPPKCKLCEELIPAPIVADCCLKDFFRNRTHTLTGHITSLSGDSPLCRRPALQASTSEMPLCTGHSNQNRDTVSFFWGAEIVGSSMSGNGWNDARSLTFDFPLSMQGYSDRMQRRVVVSKI